MRLGLWTVCGSDFGLYAARTLKLYTVRTSDCMRLGLWTVCGSDFRLYAARTLDCMRLGLWTVCGSNFGLKYIMDTVYASGTSDARSEPMNCLSTLFHSDAKSHIRSDTK